MIKDPEDEEFERIERDQLLREIRNSVLEEVAREFDKLKNFGDTSQSFARFVRDMKR
jgi:hypothetical protein